MAAVTSIVDIGMAVRWSHLFGSGSSSNVHANSKEFAAFKAAQKCFLKL
jgi:hypothetical protein